MVAPLGAVTKRERGALVKTQAKKGSNEPVSGKAAAEAPPALGACSALQKPKPLSFLVAALLAVALVHFLR